VYAYESGTAAQTASSSQASSSTSSSASSAADATQQKTAKLSTRALSTESTSSETAGSTFTVDGLGYTLISESSDSSTLTARLTSVDEDLTSVTVPASVTSSDSGKTYAVTSINFAAFSNHTKLVSVTLPDTVTSCLLTSARGSFVGCSALKSISVSDSGGDGILAAQDGVLYALYDGKLATILCYPQEKTDSSFTVPKSVSSILAYAFAENTHLTSITFQAGLTGPTTSSSDLLYQGGIGAYAFEGCTELETVAFPDDAEIATISTAADPAIGQSAFENCTSLASIELPAITSAAVKANAYESFDELNPNSTLTVGTSDTFKSGYVSYWHNDDGPVARPGIGLEAFKGCTSLKSVVFRAGCHTGAFAYWPGGNNVFLGCTSLTTLIYESAQAYWGNPNASMMNGTYRDIWSSDYNAIDTPTYYYAVNYYAQDSAPDDTDDTASTRLARVEYKRGTSVASIATSDSSLADQTADKSLYAQTSSDGTIPDPDEAAAQAGLSGSDWAWKLDNSQSRRSGLTESCNAYLVKKSELSGGRIESTQTTAMYLQADRNLSRGTSLCSDSAFDVKRYSTESTYSMTPFSGEDTPYFTFDPTTGSLDAGFSVCALDGTQLSESDYKVSYQRYNSSTGKLGKASESIKKAGAYLVTITPTTGTWTGTLTEWILVGNRTGKLVECFGKTPATTERGAKYAYSQVTSIDYSDAPYSITVGAKDAGGALIASAYAGLVSGAINVNTSSKSTSFGFKLNRSTYSDGSVKSSSATKNFSRKGLSASKFAVAVYKNFKNAQNRKTYGADSATYPWGDTALLVPYGRTADVASICAWSYAMKAPIFFTEKNGNCSKATRSALKDFSKVLVTGNTTLFSKRAFSKLKSQLSSTTTLSRIGAKAKNSGTFSLAVAKDLVSRGKVGFSVATVSSGKDPLDCILSLDLSGHEGGITLVTKSSSQSRRIAKYLHKHSSSLQLVVLFGRSGKKNPCKLSSKSFGSKNALGSIWKSNTTFSKIMKNVKKTVTDPGFLPLAEENASTSKPSSTDIEAIISQTSSSSGSASASDTSSSSSTDSGEADKTTGKDKKDPLVKQADATTAPTEQVADDVSTDSTPSFAAPSWLKFVFIIALIAVCAVLIPVLRRCR
jgi:hypothetical protein